MQDQRLKSIDKENVINKVEERSQALNGWIAADSSVGEVKGHFSGIKVMAGATATMTLVFEDNRCDDNGLQIDLVEGDYMPTPGLISATISAGKVFLIKEERFQ